MILLYKRKTAVVFLFNFKSLNLYHIKRLANIKQIISLRKAPHDDKSISIIQIYQRQQHHQLALYQVECSQPEYEPTAT